MVVKMIFVPGPFWGLLTIAIEFRMRPGAVGATRRIAPTAPADRIRNAIVNNPQNGPVTNIIFTTINTDPICKTTVPRPSQSEQEPLLFRLLLWGWLKRDINVVVRLWGTWCIAPFKSRSTIHFVIQATLVGMAGTRHKCRGTVAGGGAGGATSRYNDFAVPPHQPAPAGTKFVAPAALMAYIYHLKNSRHSPKLYRNISGKS